MTSLRQVMYCEGPGDIVAAYKAWVSRADFANETAVTFSGQFFEFCRQTGLTFYALSYGPRRDTVNTSTGTITNMPRWNLRVPKIGYELSILLYTLRLLILATRLRPRVILVTSGVSDWSYIPILRLSGAKIVPIMHNTLWANNFRPKVGLRQKLYRFAWRRCVAFTLAVSNTCARQVRSVAGNVPIVIFRPSFPVADFFLPPSPKIFSASPFCVLFAGRIEESKGVFDILNMAEKLPQVEFALCGDGQALPEVVRQITSRRLSNVKTYGRLTRPDLLERYLEAHLVIVPTRSNFAEGFAMVVAEAILQLRPVITNPVVPAAEIFRESVILVAPDQVDGYIDAIRGLTADEYYRLVEKARTLRNMILDDSSSFLAALKSQSVAFS